MKDKRNLTRCINLDTNQVRHFPTEICFNKWWQKNTRFIPQEIPAIESTIINSDNTLEVASNNATEIIDAISDVEVKTKRKYKKRKSNGIN